MDSQKKNPKAYSVEFFPPKSEESAAKLREPYLQLAPLKPCFASVTCGAGGVTQERTFETVREIKREIGIDVAPHLSCIGSTKENIRQILDNYKSQNIRHLVALRGDMPSGMREAGELRYANELVEFIRAETGDHFFIAVAAYPEFHPQASSAKADLRNFKRKVEACAAEIPRWIRKRLEAYGDDMKSLRAFGRDVTTELCQDLLDGGAPGLHFYTMNQAGPTTTIWQRLGLKGKPNCHRNADAYASAACAAADRMERGEKKHAVTCVRVCAYLSCERKKTALAGRSVLVLLFFIVVVVSWRGGSRTVFRPPRNPYASHACIRVILCESP